MIPEYGPVQPLAFLDCCDCPGQDLRETSLPSAWKVGHFAGVSGGPVKADVLHEIDSGSERPSPVPPVGPNPEISPTGHGAAGEFPRHPGPVAPLSAWEVLAFQDSPQGGQGHRPSVPIPGAAPSRPAPAVGISGKIGPTRNGHIWLDKAAPGNTHDHRIPAMLFKVLFAKREKCGGSHAIIFQNNRFGHSAKDKGETFFHAGFESPVPA